MVTAVLAVIVSATPASAPQLFDPYQIFARAQQYLQQQKYPAQVGYTIYITAAEKGSQQQRHYAARWAADTNAVAIDPVSTEEAKAPYRPAGGFYFIIPLVAVASVGGNGNGTHGDLLGVPILAPNYFFGITSYVPPSPPTPAELVEQIRDQFHDPAPAKVARLAAEQGLPTIVDETAIGRDYDIQLVGIEPYGDHRDYHLTLKPRADPSKYRLREMWISTATFSTDKLTNQGNFTGGPSLGAAWTVTFHDVDGAHYIASETARTSLCLGCSSLFWVKSSVSISYDYFTVMFENISPAFGKFDGRKTTGPTLIEPL